MTVTSIYQVTFIDGQTGIFSAFSALHAAQKAADESNVEVVKIETISRVSAQGFKMQEYELLAVKEKRLLDEKIEKLYHFIKGDVYKNISLIEQILVENQRSAMVEYSDILSKRIDMFKE